MRSNTYLGISAAFAAYGDLGLQLAAIAIAALIPLGNGLSVIVVARGSPAHGSNLGLTAALIKNPIVLACVAGLILNGLSLSLPASILTSLDTLGKNRPALGTVGGGCRTSDARGSPGQSADPGVQGAQAGGHADSCLRVLPRLRSDRPPRGGGGAFRIATVQRDRLMCWRVRWAGTPRSWPASSSSRRCSASWCCLCCCC